MSGRWREAPPQHDYLLVGIVMAGAVAALIGARLIVAVIGRVRIDRPVSGTIYINVCAVSRIGTIAGIFGSVIFLIAIVSVSAAIFAVAGVADRIADQTASNTTDRRAGYTMGSQAANQSARTRAQYGLCARIPVACRIGRDSTGAHQKQAGYHNFEQRFHWSSFRAGIWARHIGNVTDGMMFRGLG